MRIWSRWCRRRGGGLGCEDLGDYFDCDVCFLAAESLSMDAEADIVCMYGVLGGKYVTVHAIYGTCTRYELTEGKECRCG